jgi:DNA helicase-2/ATP-dependent DNA helicase PcrA
LFNNIPILKSSNSNHFEVSINRDNWRSTVNITDFLNQFNARHIGDNTFSQNSISQVQGETVKFISGFYNIVNLLPKFFEHCDRLKIINQERCIIAKRNEVVERIIAAMGHNVLTPKKRNNLKPLQEIKATLLSALGLSQTEYYEKYNANEYDIRKLCIQILKAIVAGEIHNENSFGLFVQDNLNLKLNPSAPIKIGNLRINNSPASFQSAVIVSNIHNYKGLESDAVLAIAKTEAELDLWIETDFAIRDAKRTNETTDYPRLGYVAFSRAKKLLCIGCLENISQVTKDKLEDLNVEIIYDLS